MTAKLVSKNVAGGFAHRTLRTLLAKFGLRADHAERVADELSPGERTRAGLALLQAGDTNLLILDESTNHLDRLTSSSSRRH